MMDRQRIPFFFKIRRFVMARSVQINDETARTLSQCEEVLQYRFNDRELLQRALTHSSISAIRLESNERLEFLGDAILGMAVCERLFQNYPEFAEGELTRIKSAVVSRQTCDRVSRKIHLDDFIFLGKGVTQRRRVPQSIVAGSYEALIAAIYLDGGYESARDFVVLTLDEEIRRLAEEPIEENYKSALQNLAQRDFQTTPVYRLIDEQGPDHSKSFQVAAVIGETMYPPAWGPTKKEAEQRAAELALGELQSEAFTEAESEEE